LHKIQRMEILGSIKMQPDYLSPKLQMPYYLNQYNLFDSRYYFEVTQVKGEDKIKSYISITSLADKVIPGGKQLDVWRSSLGKNADHYMAERAAFGSLFHYFCFLPIIGKDPVHGKGFDYDWLTEIPKSEKHKPAEYRLTNFQLMLEPEWREISKKWIPSFKKGLHAWFCFVQEKVDEVLAVEVTLRSEDGYAATIDLVHISKFYGKPRICITDVKSFLVYPEEDKQKGFYEAHEFQLEGCRKIWNATFPEYPVEMLFNWSPKNWKKAPAWTWKNQTKNSFVNTTILNGQEVSGFDLKVAYAKTRKYNQPPSTVFHIGGKIKNINKFKWEDNVQNISLI
jgi:hypothetical protein